MKTFVRPLLVLVMLGLALTVTSMAQADPGGSGSCCSSQKKATSACPTAGSHAAPPAGCSKGGSTGGSKAGSTPKSCTRHAGQASPVRAMADRGGRVIHVKVDGSGFHPARLQARAGESLRLVFRRTSDATCATSVDMKTLGVSGLALPLNRDAVMTVKPEKPGTYTFACPMDMVRGTLVVTR